MKIQKLRGVGEKRVAVITSPVHKFGDFWYFYDELWSQRIGPFDTEQEARRERINYDKNYLGE